MKRDYYIILVLAIILGSCASYKDLMIANGDQNDAVKGNTRVAVNENNIVTQTNNYYPFGLTF